MLCHGLLHTIDFPTRYSARHSQEVHTRASHTVQESHQLYALFSAPFATDLSYSLTGSLTCSLADITANPAVTSIAILGVLALALSPYVLVIGGLVLVFSAASLPSPLKKLLPAPVVEVHTL